MSLINKMLQDLDARGSAPGGADPQLIKPVPRAERKLVPRVALAVGLVAVLAVAGWIGWRTLHKARVTPPVAQAPMPLAKVPPGMVRITPPQPAVPPAVSPAEPPAVSTPGPVSAPVATAAVPAPVKQTLRVHAAPVEPDAPQDAGSVTRSMGAQGSEAQYRRALADLQDGRVHDAIAGLERTVQLDPRHDAARQTLVGLLVEAHRIDDAVRQLQLGLGLDPRQPAMAMLLARLQIEAGAGAAAIDTLQRTLPFAKGNGDYQAFYAGVLERQQRHGDAAAQYQAALAATPGNPLWLMGLGIALQGDNRNGEALAAYQAASASGALPAELQAFVERKLRQLKQ